MKKNGAEKLFKQMADREYSEIADTPEEKLYEETVDEDVLVDEKKDEEYYSNRISKGYGLVNDEIKH